MRQDVEPGSDPVSVASLVGVMHNGAEMATVRVERYHTNQGIIPLRIMGICDVKKVTFSVIKGRPEA